MRWLKVDADAGTNIKMKRAGRLGRELFRGVLELHAKHGRAGHLPASKSSPEALALALPAYELAGDEAEQALEACRKAGLLDVGADGRLRVVGFGPEWMPSCSKCGQPNESHSSYKTCDDCRGRRRGDSSSHSARRVPNGAERFRTVPNGSSRIGEERIG